MKKVGNLVFYKGKAYVPVKTRFPRACGKSLCAGCTFLGLVEGAGLTCNKSDSIPRCTIAGEDYIYKDVHRYIMEAKGELFEREEVTDGRDRGYPDICKGCAFDGPLGCTERSNPAARCGECAECISAPLDGRSKVFPDSCKGCEFEGQCVFRPGMKRKDYIFVPLDEERARQIQQEVEAEEDRERKEVKQNFAADLIVRIDKVIEELESIKDDIFNYESITKKDC